MTSAAAVRLAVRQSWHTEARGSRPPRCSLRWSSSWAVMRPRSPSMTRASASGPSRRSYRWQPSRRRSKGRLCRPRFHVAKLGGTCSPVLSMCRPWQARGNVACVMMAKDSNPVHTQGVPSSEQARAALFIDHTSYARYYSDSKNIPYSCSYTPCSKAGCLSLLKFTYVELSLQSCYM